MAVQCYIPKLAAVALPIDGFQTRARVAGIADASLEVSFYRTHGRCRITCCRAVADYLAGELRTAIARTTKAETRSACETGLAALLAAIDDEYKPGPGLTRGGLGG